MDFLVVHPILNWLSMAVKFGYLLQANNIKKVKSEMSTKNLLKQIPRDVLELYKGKNIDH